MKYRIALAQINSTVGDFEGNTAKIIAYIDKARALKADLVAFPELALCGYPPEDLIFKPSFLKANATYLKKITRHTKNISVVLGFVDSHKNNIYNAAALIHNGKLIDSYRKILLPNYGVFDEKRYFSSGTHCPVFHIAQRQSRQRRDKLHPDLIGNDNIIAINICEDIWHKNGPTSVQARNGNAQLIINISASPYHERKLTERASILSKQAKENKVSVAYINLTGGQDELVFDGGSMVFNDKGKLIARAKEFEEDLIVADIKLNKHSPKPVNSSLCHIIKPYKLKATASSKKPSIKIVINKKLADSAEVYSALVLGTRDYLKKNGFQKAVLGLSGGIDSAIVAAIAADAIGKDNVTAIIMPSIYSSNETQSDAEIMAKNLGINYLRIPIDDIFQQYKNTFREHFAGLPENITEENLQARIRGNILMAFSNKFGWLVLATGNKSEMSMGYCTIYGDMAGGFAVIKDVPKTLVYKLVKYYNDRERKEIIPASIIKRPPTAELRPNQKDEDSLPPYRTLDPILHSYIEYNKDIKEITKSGFSPQIVKKVIQTVDRNEYKRRQSPIGVKITRRAFGKDRRMPITNKFS
jgi:NAD+ synthase (glutamine-hydrolysing)